jgi:hypothetical protein
MQPIDFEQLGTGAKAALCWSSFWRGLAITFGSMLVGALLGGVFGFVMAASGLARPTGAGLIQYGGLLLGVASGIFFLYVYVRWLLTSRLGSYRLLLVMADK